MTSHARIEGRASASSADKTPRQRRKAFLPQLSHAKAFVLHSARRESSQVPRHVHSGNGDGADLDDARRTSTDVDTDAFKQAMWAGQANILVTVRLRPRLGHDRDNEEIVKVLDHKLVVVLDTANSAATAGNESPARRHTSHPIRKLRHASVSAAPQRRSREKRFAFDYVFTPEDGQQTVYCHTTKFLIHGVLNGFNATVFAYGCTGAGKTYTMLGTPEAPGIMARTLDDLFETIARVHADPVASVTYKVTVSFLEVYNENIRDLLVTPVAGPSAPTEFLDLREDPVRGPVIAGISEIEACNAQDVMKLLRRGNKHRSQEATAANAVSSRSHAVLQVLVEQREKASSSSSVPIGHSDSTDSSSPIDSGDATAMMATVVKFGKLSLVDLAGSERAAVTQNRGQRLLEGANINRSLLALGNCINALGEKSASATATFVPYRDSKLTRLLKDSLGGNCRTVMIANVSLAAASFEETLNTLKYANRAKNIKTTVTRNVLSVDHHITEYVGVIATLRDEVATLKQQLVQQQSMRASPSARTLRDASRSGSENNNNNSGEDDAVASADAIHARLRDVREHIARYFAERLRLREALIRTDYEIRTLKDPERVTTVAAATESEKTDATASPEVDMAASEKNQEDAGVALERRSETLARELARLETRMADFRAAILESTTLLDHALFREVLMMEYRVGTLEGEKRELELAQELRDVEVGKLRSQLSGGDSNHLRSSAELVREEAGTRLPSLAQRSPKLSLTQPSLTVSPHTTADPATDSTAIAAGSPRSTHGLMDDLRDRFLALRASHSDTSGLTLSSLSGQQQEQLQLPRSTLSTYASATSSSARKQWGLSLTNTALPYIRLKKKPSVDDLATRSVGLVGPVSAGGAVAGAPSSASPAAAGPYLRVLKHRRKSHHKAAGASSSHRK